MKNFLLLWKWALAFSLTLNVYVLNAQNVLNDADSYRMRLAEQLLILQKHQEALANENLMLQQENNTEHEVPGMIIQDEATENDETLSYEAEEESQIILKSVLEQVETALKTGISTGELIEGTLSEQEIVNAIDVLTNDGSDHESTEVVIEYLKELISTNEKPAQLQPNVLTPTKQFNGNGTITLNHPKFKTPSWLLSPDSIIMGPNLNEGFEGGVIPDNWTVINADGGSYWWNAQTTNPHTGTYCARVRWETTTLDNDDWLITPPLIVTDSTTDEISFWLRTYSATYDDPWQVLISTTNNNPASFTVIDSGPGMLASYVQKTYSLDSYLNAIVYVAIRYIGSYDWYLYVDDFSGPPMAVSSCPEPVNLTATNLNTSSAYLGWTPQGEETSWNIKWGNPGFNPATEGTLIAGVTINPYQLTGLNILTQYEFYVRANCGVGDTSIWAGPKFFQTTSNPLSGNYTINSTLPTGGTNFTSFSDFAVGITTGGLAGPVIVNVVAGTGPYNEQVMLGEIPNSSSINTLTINGNGETLEYLSTNTNERATLKLDGTDYVNINDLVVVALGSQTSPAEYGWAVWLTNQADFNIFNNCEFIATKNSTATNFAPFVTSNSATGATTAGLAANNLKVYNCTIVGGYYGMVINGPTSAPYAAGNAILNNQIIDFYMYGLYIRGQNNGIFSENEINRSGRTTVSTAYMVYLTSNMNGCEVTKNRIYGFAALGVTTSTAYGIYSTTLTADPGYELLIANNVISGYANMNGINYGIYLSTTASLGNVWLYHNSISVDNVNHPGASAIYGFYFTGASSNLSIMNNIISVTSNSTGNKYCLYFATNTATVISNYNVLHNGANTNKNIGYWNAVAYPTLEDWQTANGGIYDQNSIAADPIYASPANGNLTPGNPMVNNIGTDLTIIVPDDINGVLRSITPDPGAYEFEPTGCIQPGGLTAINVTGTTAELDWNENNVPQSTEWDIELGLAGFTPTGVPTVEGITVKPYIYGGLTASTTYEWYVRAVCAPGVESQWAGPHSFTTACGSFTAPFAEHFQNTTIPYCWEMTGPQAWLFTTSWPGYGATGLQDHSGTGGSFAGVDGSGTVSLTGIALYTPFIDISSLTTPQLRFYLFNNNTNNADWQSLRVDLYDGTAWNNSIFYWGPADNDPDWVEVVVVLTPYTITGDIQFRFVVDKSAGSPFYDDLIIDDIYVEEAPPCPNPTGLNAVNLGENSADLVWTSYSALSDIEWGLSGFTPTGLPNVTGVSSPFTLAGLQSLTEYAFYVRDDCGGSQYSNWVGPYVFQTTSTPLSGFYTINSTQPTGGTNFASFNDFTLAIMFGGLAGPVTVDVVAGTGPYNEQVILGELPNSSATNTLTINGNGEELQFLSTNTNERATLKLDGTDYVIFENLLIKALGELTSEYGWAVWLTNNADYVMFNNCHFIATKNSTSTNFVAFTTSSSATGATTAGLAASNLTITNCSAQGGYYGMVINGPSSAPYAENNLITNNTIKDFYLYGLYIRGNNNSLFSKNTISRPSRPAVSTAYMIYLTSNLSNSVISKNKIIQFAGLATTTSSAYGIYATTLAADAGSELLIFNNVISGLQNMNGTQYGMYLSTTASQGNLKVYHNSIALDHVSHPGASAIYGLYFTGGTSNLDIRNNIVSYTTNSTGTKYCLYFSTNTATVLSDYNVLHKGAVAGTNNTGYWNATPYADLTDWQSANNGIYDQNSVNADPLYASTSNGNLMPGNPLVNDIGTDLTAIVPDDINGVLRTSTPDPGAFEFTPTGCIQPGNLSAVNVLGTQAVLYWTDNNIPPATSWDIELGLSGFTPTGVPTAAGVTTNSYTYTGLQPNTTYDWYVRANCGSGAFSYWSGPHSFSTACATFTAPFTEHFQNTTIPNCWNMFGPQAWLFTTTWPGYGATGLQDHTGTGGSFAGVDGSGTVSLTGITLETPFINVSNLTNPQLRFFLFNNNTNNADWLSLRVDLWNGTSWNNSIFYWSPTDNDPDWVEVEVVLTPYNITGDIQVRFVVDKSAGSPFYDDLIIDDVFIEEAPACPKPVNLNATNITSNSADLTWASLSGLSDIEFGLSGFTPTGVPTHPGVVSPFAITGLNSSTSYAFYVRDVCGGGEYSNWAGPYVFFTPCDVFYLPFNENVNTTTFPLCWTQTHEGGVPSDRWAVVTTSNAGGLPNEFRANWVSGIGISRLITPPLNLTGTVPTLKFKHFYDAYGTAQTLTHKIQTSSDGINWTDEAFSFLSGGSNIGPENVELTLANNIGPTTYIAWVMDGNHFQFDYWYIDSIQVYQNLFGTLSGTVTDAATGMPIQGAIITVGPYSGTSATDGTYGFNVLIGTYNVTCAAAGYNGQTVSVTILDGQTTIQDFALTAPVFYVLPNAINVVIEPGTTLNESVNLSNTGNGPGDWSAGLIEINNKGTDNLFDLLFHWPTGGSSGESGVATDGNFIYTSTWNSANFYKYAMDGTFIGSFTVGNVFGIRDMTYDGTHFYGAASTTTVIEMDLANGVMVSTFTAPTAVRAIAYDNVEDVFYANNLGSDIFKFNKSGVTLASFPVGPYGTDYYGFAVDNFSPGAPFLWGYARIGASLNQLVQIQLPSGIETGVTFNVGSVVPVGTGLAGGLIISKNVVPGLQVLTGIVQGQRVWGLELTEAGPEWLTMSPTYGTLNAGENQNILLSFDAGILSPGLYEAELHFNFVPSIGSQTIPISMFIEGVFAPTNLVVSYNCTDVDLTWQMPAGAAPDSWNIYRNNILLTNVTEMSYSDPLLIPGTEYCYEITALYGSDQSSPTVPGCITLPMPSDLIPTGLAGFPNVPNGHSITLTWTIPTGCLVPYGYNIYRDSVLINTEPITEDTFIDELEETGTYLYSVSALYYFGETELSDTISIFILITGTNEIYTGELMVFPNPAKNYLQIMAPVEILEVSLIDNSGKLLRTESIGLSNCGMDLQGHEKGVYFLRIETSQGTALRKVMIK